ncbi:MAG: hypothetical protein J5808_00335, partial [Paludibacteraceae bacterium]|nr:hypothetical protein [Paludibacteraceae bacterium]
DLGVVRIDGVNYRVKTTMKEALGKDIRPYSYEVTKIELLISGSSQNGTSASDALSNSIPMAKILQGIEKSYDKGKKVLDESLVRRL